MKQILNQKHELETNLDTNFLKIIAIIAMVIDHVGKAFFPDVLILQIVGRIAFPIFAYCIVVGVVYTRSFKNYLIRLGIFAAVSQIPWTLAFNPTVDGFMQNWMIMNIFFTLFFSALFVYGMKNKNWVCLIGAISAFSLLPLDYGIDTILLLSSIYLLRNKRALACIVTSVVLAIHFFTGGDLNVFGLSLGIQGFAVLAVPFIYFKTNVNLKINKYFFYTFYPAHLLIIFLVRHILNVI